MQRTSVVPEARATTAHFSTEMFAPRDRLAAWREFVGRKVFKVDIESYSGEQFRAESSLRILPGLGIFVGSTTAARHNRPQHMVDDDDFLFAIARSGTSRFAACGREVISSAGDAVWTGGGESGFREAHEESKFICLQVPRRAIASAVIGLNDSIGQRIPAQSPALRLLQHYVNILDDPDALATPALRRQIATHIHDLIMLAVGATRDAAEIAKARGGRAARLRTVMTAIDRHLVNPALSAAWLGVQLALSDRYVHLLLAAEGHGFSDLVRRKRVELARQMLEEPGTSPRKIIDVAFAVGFGDLSSFNRAFRQRFDCTPSDVLRRRASM